MLRRCIPFLRCGEWLGCFHGIKFHTGTARILYSSYDKDLPNPALPTPVSKIYTADEDILLEQLRNARNLDRILELTSMHLDVMNAKHIVQCVDNINDLSKKGELNTENLIDNQTFQDMCSRLMKIIRLLDSQDLITVYKTFSALGIRNNTYVMQCVLKMMGKHLNDMNLGQLTFLNFLLSKQRHNSLVDGLRLALPLALQVQIEQQLDSDNMTQVVDCLQLACRSRLRPVTIQKILNAVLGKAKSLSPTNATTVIFALLYLDTPLDGYKELLQYSYELLSKNMEQVEKNQVLSILRISANENFYHSCFFFAAADKVVAEKWNLESTWEVMKHFSKLNFCPSNFMDHLAIAIVLESSAFRTSPIYSVLSCVEYISTSNYRSPHLKETLSVLCSCHDKINNLQVKSPNLLIKYLSCLAMLDCFPDALLSEILHEDFLFEAYSLSRKYGRWIDFERNILCLAWSLQVYDQQQNFIFPPAVLKSLTQSACQKFAASTGPLAKFIENGLGGPQFLKSNIFTRDGILIDHVVAMRSGNYPVALDSLNSNPPIQNFIFIEDISDVFADAKIVAIIVANADKYCRDPEVLKGWMDLKVKALAKKKYTPVVINYTQWEDMPDREKIPFLMREIKQVVEEDHLTKSSSS